MLQPEGIIRKLEQIDSLEKLTELLHRAFARLAAAGMNFTASYQTPDVTRRRIAGGECWVIEREGEIVATGVLVPPSPQGVKWYPKPNAAFFEQFAVEPELQGQGLGSRFLEFIEGRAAELGAQEVALDTAEPATSLRQWYSRRGYEWVDSAQWEGKTYRSVVLRKKLG